MTVLLQAVVQHDHASDVSIAVFIGGNDSPNKPPRKRRTVWRFILRCGELVRMLVSLLVTLHK